MNTEENNRINSNTDVASDNPHSSLSQPEPRTPHPATRIAVIGLGYVGLPLARLFATKYPTVGLDIYQKRIDELRSGTDSTLEVEDDILQAVLVEENPITEIQKDKSTKEQKDKNTKEQSVDPATRNPQPGLYCSNQLADIADANFYVVTVPTPVDKHNRP